MFEKLKLTEDRFEEISEKLSSPDIISDNELYAKLMKEYKSLTPIVEKYREYTAAVNDRDGAKELLENALKLYDERFWDEEIGLACDTWNTEFTELDDYRGVNANMHTVEAFLAVADALSDDTYRVRAGRIIDHVIAWAKDNEYRIP